MKLKYPKLITFFLIIILAFVFYRGVFMYPPLHNALINMEYAGAFVGGLLFSYGISTVFAIAVFLVLGEGNNIFTTALIGGFGAFLSDYLIFKFVRKSFKREILDLEHEKIVRYFERKIPKTLRKYVMPLIAGFVIASPLPDELGVSLMALSMKVTPQLFFAFSYFFNTLGIFIILAIGKSI